MIRVGDRVEVVDRQRLDWGRKGTVVLIDRTPKPWPFHPVVVELEVENSPGFRNRFAFDSIRKVAPL